MKNPLRFSVMAGSLLLLGLPVHAHAEEVTYRNDIRQVWKENCMACHGKHAPSLGQFKENRERYESKDRGPRMRGYAEMTQYIIWPETGALMRRLDDGRSTPDGEAGNMYQYLGATEEERQENLQLFKAWLGGEDAWFLNRWNARGDTPGVTREQLDRLELHY